jgi:hypothetical protein
MQLLVTGEQAIISIGGGLIKVYVTIRDVKISKWTKEKKLKKKKTFHLGPLSPLHFTPKNFK